MSTFIQHLTANIPTNIPGTLLSISQRDIDHKVTGIECNRDSSMYAGETARVVAARDRRLPAEGHATKHARRRLRFEKLTNWM